MTNPRHTPEPWAVAADDGIDLCITSDSLPYVATAHDTGTPDGEAEANAARIVACVNACAGMADPAASIAGLRAQVRRLDAALEKAGGHMEAAQAMLAQAMR